MDVPTLKLVLRPILTVTSVCNTGENGEINKIVENFVALNGFSLIIVLVKASKFG